MNEKIYCSKEEQKKGIERAAKLTANGDLMVTMTDLCFVEAHCQEDGIYLKGVAKKPKTGYVMRHEAFGDIRIPGSIVRAYGLDEGEFPLLSLKENEYFIRKECGRIPEPLFGELNVDRSSVDVSRLTPLTRQENRHCKMSTPSAFSFGPLPGLAGTVRVTVHMGACLRIDISSYLEAGDAKVPGYDEVKAEYKANFACCCSDCITYKYELKKNSSGYDILSVPIPKPFILKAGLSKGSHLEGFVGPDAEPGRITYVFAPESAACAFDGKTVDPKAEVPQKAVLCEDCADGMEDITPLLERFDVLNGMVDRLGKRLEETEAKLAETEKMLSEVGLRLERSDELNERLAVDNETLSGLIADDRSRMRQIAALIGGVA